MSTIDEESEDSIDDEVSAEDSVDEADAPAEDEEDGAKLDDARKLPDVDNKVKMIVEGLLLAAGKPLSLDSIIQVFSVDERPDKNELRDVMRVISASCSDRGFELKEVASGYRFQVKQEVSGWVANLWEERPPRYTRALLETLALITYRQPITRGDIEEIRGVGVSSSIIRTLIDREWIRVVGHRDVPGRPAMFATTKQFLDYFDLKSLKELPALADIKDLDKVNEELELEETDIGTRVLEVPEELVDENSLEMTEAEAAELLAEEEAIELSKKPLDEILSFGLTESDLDASADIDEDAGDEAGAGFDELEEGNVGDPQALREDLGSRDAADVLSTEEPEDTSPGGGEDESLAEGGEAAPSKG